MRSTAHSTHLERDVHTLAYHATNSVQLANSQPLTGIVPRLEVGYQSSISPSLMYYH
jgi:hypothetical protein